MKKEKSLCVLFDQKADVFLSPCFFSSDDDAVRSFCDLLEDKSTLVGKHPGDFQLIKIGSFDPDTAVVSPVFPHLVLIDGVGANTHA